MRAKQRYTRGIRLMVQTMALVFALVSVWGSLAHACHSAPHGMAQETAIDHAPDHGDGIAAASHEDHAPAPQGHTSHKGAHPCCTDLQCHSGVAIVSTGVATVIPHSVSESFAISDQTHEDAHLARLDRPPRPSAQA